MLHFKDNIPFSEIVEYIELFKVSKPTSSNESKKIINTTGTNELTATNNPTCLNELKISIQPKELERVGEINED